jgi:hypothetical protein
MKYFILSIIILISSCIIDKVYTFRYKVINNSGHDLSLYIYDQKGIDTIYILNYGTFEKNTSEDGSFSLFQTADSISVNFSNNKSLIYYYADYCNHGKSLFCPDSFTCDQLNENNEQCQFTFTEEDYLKAK